MWNILFMVRRSVDGIPRMIECHTMRNNKAAHEKSPESSGVSCVYVPPSVPDVLCFSILLAV